MATDSGGNMQSEMLKIRKYKCFLPKSKGVLHI